MRTHWQKITHHKVLLVIVVVLALAAAGGTLYYKKSAETTDPVITAAVERGNIRAAVAATGTISAVNTVDISSRITGLITEVKVKANDMVKTGQILVVLDDSSIKAQVAQYKAQLANYEAIYERSRRVAAVGGESQQQLDSDRTNYLVAKSNYDNYVSQLEYCVIKSPIDGVIISKPKPAGQTVAQGISEPVVIMTIADISKMQIKVLVDETDIGKIKVGQPVSFTVDAYTDKVFAGKVTSIIKDATTSSNVVYYPVYVDVDSSEELLYPSMTARATISVGERNNVIIAPLSAIKEEKGQKYVQVVAGGKTQNAYIKVGLSDDENIEVVSGLDEGTQIVVPSARKAVTNSSAASGPPPLL